MTAIEVVDAHRAGAAVDEPDEQVIAGDCQGLVWSAVTMAASPSGTMTAALAKPPA